MFIRNVKDGFYDCHVHIPVKVKNPILALLKEINDNGVKGFVLILNTVEEENMYLEYLQFFEEQNYKVALFLDMKSKQWLENFKKLECRGIEYIVKIHPRISEITKDDFISIKKKLSQLIYQVIIVDDWLFGYQIDNHIGTELAIYLARELPDKTIVIAHSGGYKIVETMLLTRPLKNIYYDLSLTQLYFRGASIEMDINYFIKWTNERILFGSDYPDFNIEEAWQAFKQHYYDAGVMDKMDNVLKLSKEIYGL